MKHLKEEQLILYFYGESAARDAAAAEEHLAACAECRAQLAALQRDLAVVETATPAVPARDDSYGAHVWSRVAPRLDQRPEPAFDWRAWFHMPRVAWAGAMAALLLVAFLAGRWVRFGAPEGTVSPEQAKQVSERVLYSAVGEHLERSQMLLVELANAPGQGRVNIATEQQWADDLVEANRLYRETADVAGQAGLASVLDDLERVLVEVRNSPPEMSPDELAGMRKRIDNVLFKVRVLGAQVQERERQAVTQPLGKS
jgi:hypothetical protein